MDYQQAINYLYNSLPVYQREGASAYKPGLGTSIALDDIFGNPHRKYPTIHIAGTNGKGSTAHTLAAILQSAGYKTGLYTSPHLFDFRERIRVNGEKIPQDEVISFVERWIKIQDEEKHSSLSPSFFELTSTMAFEYFAKSGVDVAIIETGLGGRLDSTNIISPILSIITNISLEHTALLGDTIEKIAYEKAGIIKPNTPIVIGEYQSECAKVFENKAAEVGAQLKYAPIVNADRIDGGIRYDNTPYGEFVGELTGDCQIKNTATVLEALKAIEKIGFRISDESVKKGFGNVTGITHLMGRWTKIGDKPLTICDTGHNAGGWEYITNQINRFKGGTVYLIIGFAADKDISPILRMIAKLETDVKIYYSSPSVKRGLQAEKLAEMAANQGLEGTIQPDVNIALRDAKALANPTNDMILIAGSNFLIADLKLNI